MGTPPVLISGVRVLRKERSRISRTLRAYLKVASLSAISLQMVVLAAIGIFRIPDEAFSSSQFRCCVILLLVCVAAAVRTMAKIAFDAALEQNEATFADKGKNPVISISAGCPQRVLVVLHAELAGFQRHMFCR